MHHIQLPYISWGVHNLLSGLWSEIWHFIKHFREVFHSILFVMVLEILVSEWVAFNVISDLSMRFVRLTLMVVRFVRVIVCWNHLGESISLVHPPVHGPRLVRSLIVVASKNGLTKLWWLHVVSTVAQGIRLKVYRYLLVFKHVWLKPLYLTISAINNRRCTIIFVVNVIDSRWWSHLRRQKLLYLITILIVLESNFRSRFSIRHWFLKLSILILFIPRDRWRKHVSLINILDDLAHISLIYFVSVWRPARRAIMRLRPSPMPIAFLYSISSITFFNWTCFCFS